MRFELMIIQRVAILKSQFGMLSWSKQQQRYSKAIGVQHSIQ